MENGISDDRDALGPHLRGKNLAEIAAVLMHVPVSDAPDLSPVEPPDPARGSDAAAARDGPHDGGTDGGTDCRTDCRTGVDEVESPPMATGLGGPNIQPPARRDCLFGLDGHSVETDIAATDDIAKSLRLASALEELVPVRATAPHSEQPGPLAAFVTGCWRSLSSWHGASPH